jgi:hypothetical protein
MHAEEVIKTTGGTYRNSAFERRNFHPYSSPVVRRIWGSADTILFIFAGAAAEFALNKAVDWLYFTGRLPSDPLGRLFSTVTYARDIIFSPLEKANASIDRMRAIHSGVEAARGSNIPDWAYRDVLFMLIFYSIRAYELLERKLTPDEKEEVVEVFINVGNRMKIPGLPHGYEAWWKMYLEQTRNDLQHSAFTDDLFRQYRKHLGSVRYFLLLEVQKLLVSDHVRELLRFNKTSYFRPLIKFYKIACYFRADSLIKNVLLPGAYKQRIKALDIQHS